MSSSSKVISFRVSNAIYSTLSSLAAENSMPSVNDYARGLVLERMYEVSSNDRLEEVSPSEMYSSPSLMNKRVASLENTVQNLVERINNRHFGEGES